MATKSFAVTLDAAGGVRLAQPANIASAAAAVVTAQASVDIAETAVDTVVTNSAAVQALEGAVITALGVLQADGALPTEAHVDDLQAAWDPLLTAINTLQTSVTTADTNANTAKTDTDAISLAAPAGLTVSIDNATITNLNQLKKALDAVYWEVAGTNFMAQG